MDAPAPLSPWLAGGALVFTIPASVASGDPPPRTSELEEHSKKRKPTYILRKEEMEALREQVGSLEAQLAMLKARLTERGDDESVLIGPGGANRVLRKVAHHQQRAVARAQAMLSQCMGEQMTFPVYSYIHLSANWRERCEVLKSIKKHKLLRAVQYVKERTGDINLLESHASIERFQDSQGGHSYVVFEVIPFEGVESLKQVFEATLFFHSNMEITISERLGHLTVRDDFDLEMSNIFNFRVVSDDESGVTTESNMVVFADTFENLGDTCERVAVIVTDCVDSDDLYPYNPSKNLRKDTTGTVVLTEHRNANGDLVVVMRRAAYVCLHKPQFDVEPVVMQELSERIAIWGDVMLKTARDIVYPRM